MPRFTPTPQQQRKMDELAELNVAKTEAKRTARARAQKMIDDELEALVNREAILAFELARDGWPVSRIHNEGLHTSARITADQAIALGEKLVGATAHHAASKEFARIAGTLDILITPPAELLAPILSTLEAGAYGELPESQRSAAFRVNDGTLLPVTEGYSDERGRHPVVALVLSDKTYQARILAWVNSEV